MSSRTLIAVAMWVGLAAGCVSTKIRSVQSFVDFPVAGAVLVADTYSWRLVALSGHRVDRVDDGRLSIEVRLKNLSGLDLPVEIKTVFHGADGVVVSQDADWRPVVIPGNSEHRYRAISDNRFAASFEVTLRTPLTRGL